MAALLFLLVFLAPWNPQGHQSESRKKQNETRDVSTPYPNSSPRAIVTTQVSQSRGSDTTAAPKSTSGRLEKAFAPEMWSQWGLLLIAVIAARIYWHTLKGTHRAADAAHISADAAKKTADSLINSERAWILVEMPEMPDQISTKPDVFGMYWIRPIIRNKGKTVAQIRHIRAIIRVHKEGEFLPETPEYPQGLGADVKNINVMLPPEIFIQPIKLSLMGEELDQANRGERFIYCHGSVEYRDFSGKERKTNFCYYYAVRLGFSPDPTNFYLEVTAPPVYNECT